MIWSVGGGAKTPPDDHDEPRRHIVRNVGDEPSVVLDKIAEGKDAPSPLSPEGGRKRPRLDAVPSMNQYDPINRYGQKRHMITEVSAVNFRQNLGEMLNQVQYRNDGIVINKDGKPVAALVDAELFARIRRMRDRFDALCDRIAEAYADTPVEQGLAEVDAATAAERKRR